MCVCVCRGGGGGGWKQNSFLEGGGASGSAAKGGLTEKVGIPYLITIHKISSSWLQRFTSFKQQTNGVTDRQMDRQMERQKYGGRCCVCVGGRCWKQFFF